MRTRRPLRFSAPRSIVHVMLACLVLLGSAAASGPAVHAQGTLPPAPQHPVKLIFIHHSSGGNWLADDHGGLGMALRDNNYFVSDTNYGWGPADQAGGGTIGDHTDLGHWSNWFLSPYRDTYLSALFGESGQHSGYSRLASDPGGPNQIVMFKSCFPNSNLAGAPFDPPAEWPNEMAGAGCCGNYTVGHAKALYDALLDYFRTRQDKLFVVITAPPLYEGSTSASQAANARAFNRWLVTDWLKDYPYHNVFVFDFYNVLTSNNGSSSQNDSGLTTGNHHRYRNGVVEYVTDQGSNYSAYTSGGDSHPTPAGNQKATAEFVPLLNLAYARWRASLDFPPRAWLPMVMN